MWGTLSLLVLLGMAAEPDAKAAAVTRAREELAKALEVKADALALEKAEAVDWPDASLGCPEPGHMYAQVITPGYRVLLKRGDARHEVHVGAGRAVVCPRERT